MPAARVNCSEGETPESARAAGLPHAVLPQPLLWLGALLPGKQPLSPARVQAMLVMASEQLIFEFPVELRCIPEQFETHQVSQRAAPPADSPRRAHVPRQGRARGSATVKNWSGLIPHSTILHEPASEHAGMETTFALL